MRSVTPTLLLRIASLISLLFTAGHTMGGLRKWSPMGDNAVLKAMTDVRFDTMGANHRTSTSSWDSDGPSACSW
jgi:hypothetical protein